MTAVIVSIQINNIIFDDDDDSNSNDHDNNIIIMIVMMIMIIVSLSNLFLLRTYIIINQINKLISLYSY